MKRILAFSAVLGLFLATLPTCGNKFGIGEKPQLELQVANSSMFLILEESETKAADEQCPEAYQQTTDPEICCSNDLLLGPDDLCYQFKEFQPSLQGESAKNMEVSIQNTGNATLTVENIYFEDGGNPYLTIKWLDGYPEPSSFPLDIEEGLTVPSLKFLVIYDPVPGIVNTEHAMLVIQSNDPLFDNSTHDGKYRMLFTVKSVGPKTQVDKTKITYGCVTGCSTTPIKIDNAGTDTLTIKSIDFASPSSEFSITNPPALPIDIPKKGDPNYNAVSFSVQYCPGDDSWEDTNTLKVATNDTSLSNQTLSIPVEVKQSPALLEFSNSSPFGYLDFSETNTHSVAIFNTPAADCDHLCSDTGHCCGCSIQLEDVTFDPPDTADWYTFSAVDPTTENQLTLPRALKGGATIKFNVNYQKPAGHPEDRNSEMCIKYVAPLSGPQDYCISMISKSECQFSLAPDNQSLHFNSAAPTEIKEKPVVLINNGSAPCIVSSVSVTNKWDGASEDYELAEVFSGNTEVPAFSVLPVWIEYSPHSDDLSGKVTVEYEDSLVGLVETVIQLSGAKEQACAIPVADAGDGYDGYGAGDTVILDGCGSAKGECGETIYDKGYIWFLLGKPPAASAQLNTEGSCITQFIPDQPGEYEIGLIVYDQKTFYQSDLATTTVTVQ
jgi:hypothetical protein